MAMSAELADRIIAAGTRAADSERKLRRLIAAVERAKYKFLVLVVHGETQNRLLDEALGDLRAATEEARK